MKTRVLLPILFVVCLTSSPATAQLRDSLRSYFSHRPKVIAGFDTRRSFLFSADARIFGLRGGLEFGRKIRLGMGYYALSSPFYRTIIDDAAGGDTLYPKFDLKYFSPYAEYVLFQDKRWEFSTPVQLGFGSISLRDTLTGLPISRQGISLFELSIVGHYKFFSWIGLGAGIGYRQILTRDAIIEESLSAPIYSLKIKIFLGVIYRAVFPKKE